MNKNGSKSLNIIRNDQNRENPFTEMMKSHEKCLKNNQMDAVNQNSKNPIDVYGVKCPNIGQSDSK